jgi:hypothetical protein
LVLFLQKKNTASFSEEKEAKRLFFVRCRGVWLNASCGGRDEVDFLRAVGDIDAEMSELLEA